MGDREKSLFSMTKMIRLHCTFIQNITEGQYSIPASSFMVGFFDCKTRKFIGYSYLLTFMKRCAEVAYEAL